MPIITLPDGSQRRFDQPLTVHEVATAIGPGLAKAALAGRVNGRLVDTSYCIDQDVAVVHGSPSMKMVLAGSNQTRAAQANG